MKEKAQHYGGLFCRAGAVETIAGYINQTTPAIEAVYQMFTEDSAVEEFSKQAKDNSTEMFVQSLLPDKFRDIVPQCFLDNNGSFAKLFNDADFCQKVQDAMAQELYKVLQKG